MEASLYQNYLSILKSELIPALGCTEPIAIAYGAARARQVLGEFPDYVEMRCSGNIIKNVKGVVVPNSGGLRGIDVAAALGVVAGDAQRELEVLTGVTEADIEKTKKLVAEGFCRCSLQKGVANLFIVAKAVKGEHWAEVTIVNRHTLITRVVKDGEILYDQEKESENTVGQVDKSRLNIHDILTFVSEVKLEDIREVIGRQIAFNSAIAEEGLKHPYGAQVGRTLWEHYGNHDVKVRARAKAAAGSDARMGGCSMPVVINSGSGNQGMTVSLPVIEFAKELQASEEKLYKALAFGNLVAIHQKKYIGSLSAYCGAVSAACGAGAAIAWLLDATEKEIDETITNTICNVGGIVCDGAKSSCAAKIASAVDAAVLAVYMALHHRVFQPGEGLVQTDVEDTIRSVGYIGRVGMSGTDEEILSVMIGETRPSEC